ncbi:SDR family NAD(P)-dependent oxidoreductase [Sphingomonas sp. ID0503]|uniref:SDR family NAD(P)-dependent oxidoreductase n=1 Tax=Sphingomonas sp. ID0503 TaxID=3399691 RepID=UPI003AFB29BB
MAGFFDLSGKVAVVTGGASGIGAAIAQRLRKAGAAVVIADLTDAAAQAAEWDCDFRRTDVSQEAEIAALLDHAVEKHGRLDILVSNAAVANVHEIASADLARAERYFQVNSLSALSGIREAAKRMEAGGSIINTASLSGIRGTPGWGEYAMSKAAVVAATQTAAIELGPRGIRVNAVCPGGVRTPLAVAVNGDALDKAMKVLSPLGRIGEPDEIAAMVHFLASDDASYVTGQAYLVDGGWSIGTTVATIGLALGQ